jgi:hypothetical protein
VGDSKQVKGKWWRQRRVLWGSVGAVAGLLLLFSYIGFGKRHPMWKAPLEYPNKGAGKDQDPTAFSSAAVCGTCHQTHYQEWLESGMGRSSEVSSFLIELYQASLDIRGAPTEDVAQCLHCHAPTSVMGPEPDLELAQQVSQEGVTCDVCHTAYESHANDAPGMLRWDPTGPKRGPLPGTLDGESRPEGLAGVPVAKSTHHETQYSKLHETSELCGACHMSLWPTNALPIDWTYAEWQRSPYPERGQTCQSCHMPTYEGQAATGQSPVRKNLHRHTFPAGGDVEFVKRTAVVDIEVFSHYAGNEVEVRVENVKAGHAFPTGNATAPVVKLVLVAFDENDAEIFRDKREFRLLYADEDGEVTNDPSIAVRLISDTTLQPLEPRHERFFLPQHLGAKKVFAQLIYQRWSDDVVNNHTGLAAEFFARYLQQGVRVHRVLAHLDKLRPSMLERVKSFQPIVVDSETASLPAPPDPPDYLRARELGG